MEGDSAQPPLKICPSCSVASRTEAETCPNCGASYERRGAGRWVKVPLAILVVALAFAGGYFGLSKLVWDDDEPEGLTAEEAEALPNGSSEGKLDAVIDDAEPARAPRRQNADGTELLCRYYFVVDAEDTVWEACYLEGRLEVSRALPAASLARD
jgi:hypothetical protein